MPLFYNMLYVYYFRLFKKRQPHPEITTLGILSLCQGANCIFGYLIYCFFIYRPVSNYVPLGFFLFFLAMNYVWFQKKKMGYQVQNTVRVPKYFGLLAWLYLVVSLVLPFVFIIFFDVLFKG